MKPLLRNQFRRVLSHLYINPLERCNLRCAICYTRKTDSILTLDDMSGFIERYKKFHSLETVTFCGGEVFTLPYFPTVVNLLTGQGIFVQVITNGTLDRLTEFSDPNDINLIVSLDGLPDYHDKNRGKGNFGNSLSFLKHAHSLGFHTEIFSIVTRQNFGQIDDFETYLADTLKFTVSVTYHPRKPPTYLLHHPDSNIFGKTDGFDFLTDREMLAVLKNRKSFPPKELGCFQVVLVSDGRVFGCCEGTIPIGTMKDSVGTMIGNLKQRITDWERTKLLPKCLGCSQPDFVCGIKPYLTQIYETHRH